MKRKLVLLLTDTDIDMTDLEKVVEKAIFVSNIKASIVSTIHTKDRSYTPHEQFGGHGNNIDQLAYIVWTELTNEQIIANLSSVAYPHYQVSVL